MVTLALTLIVTVINLFFFALRFSSATAVFMNLAFMSIPYGFLLISAFATQHRVVSLTVLMTVAVVATGGTVAYFDALAWHPVAFSNLAFLFVPFFQSMIALVVGSGAEVYEAFHPSQKKAAALKLTQI
ncbi:MAG: hypothetical protein AB1813_07925 [Verrucomicrobiota bacterium]